MVLIFIILLITTLLNVAVEAEELEPLEVVQI
jgi:hypothetical protein